MSNARIRSAFETRLAAWAVQRQMPVVWQNAPQIMPSADHLRAYLLPGATQSLDLQGTHRAYSGLFQISIFCRAGTGSAHAERIAAQLDELFPVALRMTQDGLLVQVTTPMTAKAAIQETDWYSIPVSCRYAAQEFKT